VNELQLVEHLSTLNKLELRDYLKDLEVKMKSAPEEQQITNDIEIIHHFSKGVYAREMRQPKGSLVLGKIHKHENLCIISSGEVSVISVDGVMRVQAPYTFVASPGAQRVILAHEDTVWTVIHGTNERDIEKIEDEFIAKTYEEVVELPKSQTGELPCHG
jgi:hypothetical protein